MAELNLDYYQNTDRYSDGDIEEVLLAYVKGTLGKDALAQEENVYPILYHLSPLRENILNWYPFARDARILEVGSGCGALTRLLCRSAKEVVSAELSKRRASINYERNKDCANLRIMVGNLNDMQFDGDFDYIVLNGVLEYAMSFTEGEKPYEQFINSLCRFLKPGGHLLIAIENRMGLKYFNGAPEDHTGHYFESIDRYPDNDTVRTFSRMELSKLLHACGLSVQRFYYPYPDYKFPTEIFTDETICTYGYGRPFVNLDEKRGRLFEESGVWRTLAKENAVAQFANSFLVDAAASEWEEPVKKLYVKLNNDRADAFRIATSIEQRQDTRVVVKTPLTDAAKRHLQTMCARAKLTPNEKFVNLQGELASDGSICYPFLTGETLDTHVQALIMAHDADGIVRLLHKIFDEYGKGAALSSTYATPEFADVFGPAGLKTQLPCVRPANIDLICDNIFEQNDKYCIIDCEWIFDMEVPVPFIIWRCINELYTNHHALADLITRKRLLAAFDIDKAMGDVFWQWATYFAKTYVGSSTLENYTKPMKMIPLEDYMRRSILGDRVCCSLYYDVGEGFSEEHKIYREVPQRDGHFSVTYDLSALENVHALRWDPLEGYSSTCRLYRVTGAKATPANVDVQEGEKDIFLTTDPIYMLEPETGAKQITIEGTVHKFDAQELAAYISERLPVLQWQSSSLQDTLRRQQQEVERLREALTAAETAERQARTEKKALERQHSELTDAFGDLRTQYDAAMQELNAIHASRSWRLLNKLKGK